MEDLIKLAIQGLSAGGIVGVTGLMFGYWDRRMKSRADQRAHERGQDQDALSERKEASTYLREALAEARKENELLRRDLAAERETNRLQTVRLAEKRQLIGLWEARGRAMDNFAHWLFHEANALQMRMYAAGRLGRDPKAVGRLPAVPSLESVTDWVAPEHAYASAEEIAATFAPPPAKQD